MTGPFESRAGTIIAIDGDVATVTLDVFARKTPVQIRVADLAAPPRTN
jgi:transcription antitermination factor NusG